MPETIVLARLIPWEINSGSEAVPNWVNIGGLDGAPLPQREVTRLDDSDNDSAGLETSIPVSERWTAQLTGQMKEDPDTGARDAGQEACEAAAALGYAGVKQFRCTSPGGTVKTAKGTCNVQHGSADRNGKIPWTCDIEFREKPV
ncbi:MAG: hypothetical protein IBX61_09405 [Thermoleophilia bacterium]|nr:hypothetical protein [Thermoleophilia bacterium]